MAAEPRPRVKGLEAKRLGLGRFNHFPDIYAHPVEEHLELVYQGDVDGAVGVFQDLGGLGCPAGRNRHGPGHDLIVEGLGHFQARWGIAADHLGYGGRRVVLVVGVLALRRKGQEEIASGVKARLFFQDVPHVLVGGTRVSGRFQDDQLAAPQVLGDGVGGVEHKAHVWLAVFVERCGNADEDGVGGAQLGKVGGGVEAAGLQPALDEG